MPQSLIRAGFTAAGGLGALLGLLAADADASAPAIQRNWVNSAGGSFHTATNWNPLGEPGPLDTAVFDVGTLYTITFSQSATNKLLIIDDVDVTFDLPPFAVYALNGVVIGDNNSVTPGRLRLINGIVSVQPLPPPPPPPLMVRIGKDIGVTGELSVSGTAQFSSTDIVLVGDAGTGILRIFGGGTVSTALTNLGDDVGSVGIVIVDGTGSTATFGGTLFVGNFGSGSLEITNGGSVTAPMVFVADDLGSTGTILVDGVGSTWTVNSELFLGNASTGTASITNGAAAFTSRVKVGDNPGSTGTVTVDGPGSSWTDSVEIFVGNFGSGSLAVTNGAAVSGPRMTIGDDPGSSGIVTVSGPGSTLSLSQQLTVGDLGQGTLRVVEGGVAGAPVVLVNTGGLVQGNATISGSVTNSGTVSPGLSTGNLAVDGSYTQSITGALAVELGCAAANALTVSGAAQLAGTLDLSFAAEAPAAGQQFAILSAATVAGVFSQVNAPGAVTVTYEPTAVVVTVLDGDPPATGDLNGDGTVGVPDLLALLAAWGACPPEGGCPADLNGDGDVGVPDLLALLASWGRCA